MQERSPQQDVSAVRSRLQVLVGCPSTALLARRSDGSGAKARQSSNLRLRHGARFNAAVLYSDATHPPISEKRGHGGCCSRRCSLEAGNADISLRAPERRGIPPQCSIWIRSVARRPGIPLAPMRRKCPVFSGRCNCNTQSPEPCNGAAPSSTEENESSLTLEWRKKENLYTAAWPQTGPGALLQEMQEKGSRLREGPTT